MSSLQKRLLVSAVVIPITCLTIFKAPDWLFFIIVEAFNLLALYEYLVLSSKKNLSINLGLGLFWGALLPVSIYFSYESVILVLACLSLFIYNFSKKHKEHALVGTSVTVFGIIYVTWFFSHVIKVHELEYGPQWVFYTILLVKGGDAGAYFVGRKFGRTKLIEHISPNKSVEGAIGGFATSIILSVVSKIYLPHIPLVHLVFLGAILGIVSQLGDLAESAIKRDVGVKDSGNIPGIGGVLDMLDSLLLSFPIVYYYLIGFVLRG